MGPRCSKLKNWQTEYKAIVKYKKPFRMEFGLDQLFYLLLPILYNFSLNWADLLLQNLCVIGCCIWTKRTKLSSKFQCNWSSSINSTIDFINCVKNSIKTYFLKARVCLHETIHNQNQKPFPFKILQNRLTTSVASKWALQLGEGFQICFHCPSTSETSVLPLKEVKIKL